MSFWSKSRVKLVDENFERNAWEARRLERKNEDMEPVFEVWLVGDTLCGVIIGMLEGGSIVEDSNSWCYCRLDAVLA